MVCRVDEIAHLADLATAAQAYYRQSLDVENEMNASRIGVRAERRLGEILKRMRETGERRTATDGLSEQVSKGSTPALSLADLGIIRDRASRAVALANVEETEFEAAMTGAQVAQPGRIVRESKGAKNGKPVYPVPIEHTLDLWRD